MDGQMTFEFEQRKPIKGYPELHWRGKRPYTSTQYYPAQLKESYGESKNGWMNKIFWGDNLQVMSYMLKEYREKVDLIYIDPPFDSKVDYKKTIKVKNKLVVNDSTSFEEKQYGDIWTNDEYIQFMYERLIVMRELLSDKGAIYVHCDWHKSHHIRLILDEVFGQDNFINEISWLYKTGGASKSSWAKKHDTILYYAKKQGFQTFNPQQERSYMMHKYGFKKSDFKIDPENGLQYSMVYCRDVWDLPSVGSATSERVDYPTQKPENLLERIITASSNEGDLIFDCFMGSGTTQAVALKMGRKFIGADINLGSIQTTTKRLLNIYDGIEIRKKIGFEVYNVNNYEFFRNPVEAKELLIDALGIQKFDSSTVYDGELDGYMVKIMPTNRIATKADLEELKANLPYKTFEKRKEENPNAVVERIKIVCMGHEADLKASLEQELSAYKLDIDIVDILRDKSNLQFKREADARVEIDNGKLVIKEFYPMNLLQKLSMQKESVEDWRQLVESVFVDWNYDGETMRPKTCDIPGKDEMVSGTYDIPSGAGKIKVKITDLLSESLEVEV